jgi:hypothetical protein
MYATGYDETLYGDGMGFALPAIGGAISAIGGLFGGSKDPGRLQSNQDAYNLALSSPLSLFKDQGVQPTAFLLLKSPKAKGGQGGWATDKAQNDAWTKFSGAKTTLTGRGYGFVVDGSVTPPSSGPYVQTASYGGSVSPSLVPTPGGPIVAGLSTGPLLIAGAAAVALVMLMKK